MSDARCKRPLTQEAGAGGARQMNPVVGFARRFRGPNVRENFREVLVIGDDAPDLFRRIGQRRGPADNAVVAWPVADNRISVQPLAS